MGKKKTNRKEPIKLFYKLAKIHNLRAGIHTKGVEDMLVTLEGLGKAVTTKELILGDCEQLKDYPTVVDPIFFIFFLQFKKGITYYFVHGYMFHIKSKSKFFFL